ncbi:hypothetical protein SAMN05216596_102558 [Pseudomonas congelans]|uniref:Uncharacterized protein n=1 Tax=Pseudomonas congelans TaxID=200452 RepID=A0A1H0P8F9_9PSED|nr:hypothetical protein SAMN05216596_102558 [Pseudomonas congelans]
MRRGASHDIRADRSARSSVGMQFSTLCVAGGRRASGKAYDAERRTIFGLIVPPLQRGSAVLDALRCKRTQSVRNGIRRGAPHDIGADRSARSSVGMQFPKLCVAGGRRASGKAYDAERRTIVEIIVPHAPRGNAAFDALRRRRTQSVRKGMRRGASHDIGADRSARSSVGMQLSTLCVVKRT